MIPLLESYCAVYNFELEPASPLLLRLHVVVQVKSSKHALPEHDTANSVFSDGFFLSSYLGLPRRELSDA